MWSLCEDHIKVHIFHNHDDKLLTLRASCDYRFYYPSDTDFPEDYVAVIITHYKWAPVFILQVQTLEVQIKQNLNSFCLFIHCSKA